MKGLAKTMNVCSFVKWGGDLAGLCPTKTDKVNQVGAGDRFVAGRIY